MSPIDVSQPQHAVQDAATLAEVFRHTVETCSQDVALKCAASGRSLTWAEYGHEAAALADGFTSMGMRAGDHVVLMLSNRADFYLVDTALMLIRGIPVSVYNSPSIERLSYIWRHCSPVAVIVEDDVQLERARAAAAESGHHPRLVAVEEVPPGDDLVMLADLAATSPTDLAELAGHARPGDTATMLYTSGTTGDPKGVPLTHRSLLFAARTLTERMGISLRGRRQLSYLPMAHIGERLATHYVHMLEGSEVTCCARLESFPDVLAETQPHMLFGAPRMWEKLYTRVQDLAVTGPDESLHRHLETIGLGHIDIAIVGSAPLPRHIQEFWHSAGIPLADCYGQSETCGVGTWDPHDLVLGTCGKPFDGVEVAISDLGEILVRSDAVFSGYYRDSARTRMVLDSDGWFHTSDLGSLDPNDNLTVRGRVDDLLVPTSGHNVSPAPIEARLLQIPLVSHAVLCGSGKPFITALLVLDSEAVAKWAADRGWAERSPATLATDPELRSAVSRHIDDINTSLPGAERIKSFALLPGGETEWTPDTPLMTATGKIRRAQVLQRYAEIIESMYP
ncbi:MULTISPECIES: long-chain fatty acid--CoA ligase [unclassified Rhodococcus (in: high G+C Gram-positive bacteria)]|uniref:AMP-dependent synthetase/ligase n=1 Tax=unclassified Rhodococcus (in: high G+C Gram-positive bacteria) TaxID=192944 RepID=UPI00163993BE|nr:MULTISPECIES: AMP-dependent synthetase/ligase [unclassified Rhodococcus (in: high G+C Gram-positive bacteria)]MBC2640281.1 AMP-binding protein [Rhodococcus sp. 3A]MBC2894973.1 AMP-binding protein [Rhodococcus sp. 4CII]